MTITELVLLILNFTLCIVCLWLSLLKQKLNTTRSMCNVERAPYYIAMDIFLFKLQKNHFYFQNIVF